MSDSKAITHSVKQLYERFPYPTPTTDLAPFIEGQVLELGFPRLFFHKYWPFQTYRENLDILIAGCGSSQAARYAAAHPGARITGIDLSEASLNLTKALADRYGLKNLNLEQAGIEQAGKLEQQFDLIVSTGVVHHLPEPANGLQALYDVLRPDGAIYWMVYAPFGRDAIYYLQSFLKDLGVSAENLDEKGAPALKHLLNNLPPGHPLWHRRRQFPDLMDTAELIDYLLHPQDQPFTIRQCYELAQQCGFAVQDVFNRAYYQLSPERAGDSFFQRWCRKDELTRLEAGERWRAAMIRHDLISCRADRPATSYRVDLQDESLIPIRVAGLQTDIANAPQGKAATVFWPGHAFDDIRLTVDATRFRIIQAIDGKSSIENIRQSLSVEPQAMQQVLQELANYDYVFFKKV